MYGQQAQKHEQLIDRQLQDWLGVDACLALRNRRPSLVAHTVASKVSTRWSEELLLTRAVSLKQSEYGSQVLRCDV